MYPCLYMPQITNDFFSKNIPHQQFLVFFLWHHQHHHYHHLASSQHLHLSQCVGQQRHKSKKKVGPISVLTSCNYFADESIIMMPVFYQRSQHSDFNHHQPTCELFPHSNCQLSFPVFILQQYYYVRMVQKQSESSTGQQCHSYILRVLSWSQ